ncbi:hypothetical protein EG338_08225 [Kaistella haifensis]|jgi:hypothetical protein|uniref:DUF1281 family ferredoxin-like fold protein n=1 Tax=Chryseobacterium sp. 5_R23647 TaxID=2258964 RepID=UPI000E26202A|nr:hypothetical protein [Chryseobacterium sp. 5_R23647]AZB22052.1 hypothetical protein EG338_08225 [Kaistella haifensis]MBP7500208.1 hypothetical protein [Chryseobacterium sp.]REC41479.1 hypothetical protein DRF69_14865 [Chryseobacterium sp. 5_R23647]
MANWCRNTLAFEGNETALEQIKSKFRRMINLERSEQCGQLPDFVNPKVGGYFFDIIWDEGDCIFNYQTKWSPHTDILIQIAKRHNVDFIHDYEEMGNLTEIGLDNDEFEQYHYDEETETYHFQGKIFDNDCEILEILLEEKINHMQPQI